jgi:exodeoxyribonuclease-3
MRIATWNVNSLKVRLPRVLEFLEVVSPDVLCLQETKCEAAAFPTAELAEAGYDAAHHSGGRWAGVAVLARQGLGLTDAGAGLEGEVRGDEARWIEVDVGEGLRVASAYVTNGREVGTETFDEKLTFLDAMVRRAGELRATGTDLVITGDLNVTRDDRDVYDPAAFAGSTHVTPQERGRLEALLTEGGLIDAHRTANPEDTIYTWWDYRQGHFHRGMGLRIDYILLPAARAGDLRSCAIVRDFRKGAKPSDHAPLVAELA